MLIASVDCRLELASFMMELGTPTVLIVMLRCPMPRSWFKKVCAFNTDGRFSIGSPMPMKTAIKARKVSLADILMRAVVCDQVGCGSTACQF